MKVFKTREEVREFREALRSKAVGLGLVPTMGALHTGHLELVRRAASENPEVLVSIFVNPTQFNNPRDLENYPKSLEEDLALLGKLPGSISVFAPEIAEMYGDAIASKHYDFKGLDRVMEGAYRPGHFDGVGTIVEALLRVVLPHRAYFGEKDYQQLQIVRQMVQEEGITVEIIPCPIVREADGLAMSSRNRLLPEALRGEAGFIYQTLQQAKGRFGTESAAKVKAFARERFASHPDFELEYVEIAGAEDLRPVRRKQKNKKYRVFVAAYLGGVRLIDNIALN
ncbi:pantoate--beta-alanine ligase [Robiginitalea marina]|uniref:Pantothenate synthetase n=1 Tax=Robiginitalea marina TaxID=2954105 RepID=A0ABT1AWV0_9FLAO|nr:pantoate--beta-alanine ligase [Robiginitalea marina]MCO5724487.1 pantoate--beta-alanine ligase [Robiginitalea marina]